MIINQGGGGVTSVGATAPVLSSGGANPVISLAGGVTNGNVLTWNGAAWVPAPVPSGGVTSVTASSPLASSGGNTPNISINPGAAIGDGLVWDGAAWVISPLASGAPTLNWAFVAKNGSDGPTADGSIGKPYLTIAHALASIPVAGPTAPSPTNRWTIFIASGRYVEVVPLNLRADVMLFGSHWMATRIAAPSWGLNADFTPAGDHRSGVANAAISGNCTWDFNAIASNEGKLYFENVWLQSQVDITAFSSIQQYFFNNVLTFAPFTVNGGNLQLNGSNFQDVVTLNSGPTDPASTFDDNHSTFEAGLTINKTGVTGFTVALSGSTVQGTLSVTGAVIVAATGDALPPKAQIALAGGAALARLTDAYGTGYTPAVPGNWPVVPDNISDALDELAALSPPSPVTGAVTTSGDAVTQMLSLTPTNNATTVYQATVAAKKQGTASGAGYGLAATFVKSAGVVTQVGATQVLWSHESIPALDTSFAISGGNVRLNVVGEANVPALIDPVTPPTPSGATYTVGTLGGETYPDLATALAAPGVVNGDRLLLSAQAFTVASGITVAKQVTIQGTGLGSTTIQTAGAAGDPVVLMTISTSNVTLRDLTLKQRKTTNTAVESALSITAGAGSSGHFLEAVRVGTMEFGVILKSDGWQINNCELAYVGPNNSTRRLLAIYRSDGQGLFCNTTYDSGQDGVITGNTRLAVVTTGSAPPDEVLGGYLRFANITPSNGYPVQQFFNVDYFAPGTTLLELVVDGCASAETSAFVVFTEGATQPPLSQCSSIALLSNTLTNSHGKGAIALNGAAGLGVPGTTIFYASGNAIANTAFIGTFATGISPASPPSVEAQLGYDTVRWSNPSQTISASSANLWDWTGTVTTETAP
jgi:hypothetical protein